MGGRRCLFAILPAMEIVCHDRALALQGLCVRSEGEVFRRRFWQVNYSRTHSPTIERLKMVSVILLLGLALHVRLILLSLLSTLVQADARSQVQFFEWIALWKPRHAQEVSTTRAASWMQSTRCHQSDGPERAR